MNTFDMYLREIALRQALPGYSLAVLRAIDGSELLAFQPTGSGAANAHAGITLYRQQFRQLLGRDHRLAIE